MCPPQCKAKNGAYLPKPPAPLKGYHPPKGAACAPNRKGVTGAYFAVDNPQARTDASKLCKSYTEAIGIRVPRIRQYPTEAVPHAWEPGPTLPLIQERPSGTAKTQ